MEQIVYTVSIRVNTLEDKTHIKIIPYAVTKETSTRVYVKPLFDYIDRKYFDKNNLMNLQTDVHENVVDYINYNTLCYKEDIEKAKQLLIDKSKSEVERRMKELEVLKSILNTIEVEEITKDRY